MAAWDSALKHAQRILGRRLTAAESRRARQQHRRHPFYRIRTRDGGWAERCRTCRRWYVARVRMKSRRTRTRSSGGCEGSSVTTGANAVASAKRPSVPPVRAGVASPARSVGRRPAPAGRASLAVSPRGAAEYALVLRRHVSAARLPSR